MVRIFLASAMVILVGLGGLALADLTQQSADEQLLKNANLKSDPETLLKFLKQRTLAEGDREKVQNLVRQLGADSFRVREQATTQLISQGPVVAEMLREALKSSDPEVVQRAEKCLLRIQESDFAVEIPTAVVRLLGVKKPAGTVETILAFLPFAGHDEVDEEARKVLAALAVPKGKADPVLVKALTDKNPIRRAAAAEALARAGAREEMPAIRKLLQDPQPLVRLRVAIALAYARETEAVAVLIDLLPDLSMAQAWKAEDILLRLADGHGPPRVSLGKDLEARKKCRKAWTGWWKKNSARVNLARLADSPPLRGYSLVVLLDEGEIVELNAKNEVRWKIDGIALPLDVQMLPGHHVLVAEYHASQVVERNSRGEIKWKKHIIGPLVGQRLPGGNTFIATDTLLMEVDAKGKEVFTRTLPGERIMKAAMADNHEIVCLTTEPRVVRIRPDGKEVYSFPVPLANRLFGGRIHVLANGNVLVPHNGENKVVEYNKEGKVVWEVAVDQPIAATRLANGDTLVTTMLPNRGAVQFDRTGTVVWQFRANTRVTRALRR